MSGVLETVRGAKFRNKDLVALYTEISSPAKLALVENILEEEAEAIWLEARSILENGLAQDGRMAFFETRDIERMHPRRVKAWQLIVDIARPDWVERVAMACMYDNVWDNILRWSKVPPYPAYAIIRNMKESGQLPPVIVDS